MKQTAKHKLNAAHFLGSLLLSSLIGWIADSLIAFAIALIVLLVVGYYAGDIRR